MLGILLATLSSGFVEASDTIGKREVSARKASVYSYGFLDTLIGTIILITIGVFRDSLYFSPESLPTFIPRLFLEVLQAHIMVLAVVKADRSDFGIIRSITMPLLLIVDLTLGYALKSTQILGICTILAGSAVLFYYEWRSSKALGLLLLSAVNAVATISLYKYDITHFNSVESEQSIIMLVLLFYFFVLAKVWGRQNPLTLLKKPIFAGMSLSSGVADVTLSFAYAFAPASIILTAFRASSVLFAIASGRYFFKERRIHLKLMVAGAIIVGLILLTR